MINNIDIEMLFFISYFAMSFVLIILTIWFIFKINKRR